MKQIFTIIAVFAMSIATAQPPKFQEVVEVPNASADALYARAKEWFAETFVSAQHVIQLDDAQNYKLIGKGNTGEYLTNIYMMLKYCYGQSKFTVKVECKDGRYRYSIYDIEEKWKTAGDSWSGYQSFQTVYEISHPDGMAKAREREGLKPLKPEKLEKRCKHHIKRYEILVAEIEKIRSSLKDYMSKTTSSEEDDW